MLYDRTVAYGKYHLYCVRFIDSVALARASSTVRAVLPSVRMCRTVDLAADKVAEKWQALGGSPERALRGQNSGRLLEIWG